LRLIAKPKRPRGVFPLVAFRRLQDQESPMLRKTAFALVAVTAMALVPTAASARFGGFHGGGGWGRGIGFAGAAAGVGIGLGLAGAYGAYAAAPYGYDGYDYGPGPVYGPAPVYGYPGYGGYPYSYSYGRCQAQASQRVTGCYQQ
jgi:hypothetical protein